MERADEHYPDDEHYRKIAEKLALGRIVPFLGAGANLCDRGVEPWERGGEFLPSGAELAGYLAGRGGYPVPGEANLMRVSEYVQASSGEADLYSYLREVFVSPCKPTSLHRLLARTARKLADAYRPPEPGRPPEPDDPQHLLVVTTNYDDLVEQALDDEGLAYDVFWYEAKDRAETRGRFIHRPPPAEPGVKAKPKPVPKPNKYKAVLELTRPAVLKLHGCLDRDHAGDDSYVITEDSYIDYLSLGDVGELIPIALRDRMQTNSLLFLGYSLSDWNLRVVMNRLWEARTLGVKSWAIQRRPRDPNEAKIEQALWNDRQDIKLEFCELGVYVGALDARLSGAAPATSGS